MTSKSGQYFLVMGLNCYKWYQSQTLDSVPLRMRGLPRECTVRSHDGWRRERNVSYKRVKTSPKQMRFKNREADSDT